MKEPSAPFGNGRDASGRFAKGNSGGPGNPQAKRVGELRTAFLEAVSTEDMRLLARKLLEQAKAGDVQAAREVLMRTLGRPTEADILERMDHLEELFARVVEVGGR